MAIEWAITAILLTFLVGVVVGQLSVWRKLRQKGLIKIGDWEYTAIKIFRLG